MSVPPKYQILTLNQIASHGLHRFPGARYAVGKNCAHPDAILVRSHDMPRWRFRDGEGHRPGRRGHQQHSGGGARGAASRVQCAGRETPTR